MREPSGLEFLYEFTRLFSGSHLHYKTYGTIHWRGSRGAAGAFSLGGWGLRCFNEVFAGTFLTEQNKNQVPVPFVAGRYKALQISSPSILFGHSRKASYTDGAIDGSYWHTPADLQQLHPEDRDNPIWSEPAPEEEQPKPAKKVGGE